MLKSVKFKICVALAAAASMVLGFRLNRKAVISLGGDYSLLTEFKSDLASNLMYSFEKFSNFSVLAALFCVLLLGLLIKHGYNLSLSLATVYFLYFLGCTVYLFAALGFSAVIFPFIIKRAILSSVFILIPLLFQHE